MKIKDWNIQEVTGYEPITTFYTDFSIADNCLSVEPNAVLDTFKNAFNNWKDNYKYLTELVMVLNWKIYEHYESNYKLAEVYNELWEKADLYATSNLKGEELQYFFRTTD